MAIRTISVKVTANVAQYNAAMRKAATATKQFSQATNVSRGMGQTAQNLNKVTHAAKGAGKGMQDFHRIQGNVLARQKHTSAILHRTNTAFRTLSQTSGLAAKGMALLKLAVTATVSAFAGFIFINAAVNAAQSFFRVVIGGFTDFNKAITETMAIIPDATGEIEKGFTEASQAIAKVTKFSPDEIAEGFYYLASAGYTSAQSIASMDQVAKFAQAGVMDLAEASEIAADTVAAMGLSDKFDPKGTGESIERVTDVMVDAARKANATVKQFGEAFTNKFANMLAITNKSVEEGAAILGAFANQGIKGQVAGTRATMALRDLQRASIKNGAAFDSMNISVYDSNGNMRHTADILGDMEVAFDGLSDKQKKAALTTLGFQDRSVQALLAILGSSDAIRDMDNALDDASGTVQEVAEKQMKSLSNRLNQAVSIMKSFSVEFGNKVAASVEDFVKRVTPAWNKMFEGVRAVVNVLGQIAKPLAFLTGGAFVGTVNMLGKAFEALAWAMKNFSGVFAGLGLVMLARWLPIGGVLEGIKLKGVRAFGAIKAVVQGATFDVQKFNMALNMGLTPAQAKIAATTGGVKGLSASLKAAGLSAVSLKSGLKGMVAAAPMAALMAIPMAMQVFSKNTSDAKAEVEEFMSAYGETNTLDKLQSAHTGLMEEMQRSQEGLGAKSNTVEELWQNLNPFIDNAIQREEEAQKERERILHEQEEAYGRQKDAIKEVQKELGVSADVVEQTAIRNGINLQAEGTQWDEAVETVKGAILDENEALGVGLEATDEFAEATDEELSNVRTSFEDLQKGIEDTLGEIYGPAGALEAAKAQSEAIFASLYSPSDVYGNLMTDAEDAAQAAAEAQTEAYNKALEGRVEGLEKVKEEQGKIQDKAIEKAKKREKDGMKEIKDAQQDAIDDQIDALNDQKKEQDDFYKEPSLSLDSLVAGFEDAVNESEDFSNKLNILAHTGASSALIETFREMGEEAIPYLDAFLAAGETKKQQIDDLVMRLHEPPEVNLSLFRKELEEKTFKGKMFERGVIEMQGAINLDRFELPKGTTVNSLLKQLLGMGPEGEQLVQQMIGQVQDDLNNGTTEGIRNVEETLNQVFWSNDFMGILTSMGVTMSAADEVAQFGSEQIVETLAGSYEHLAKEQIAYLAQVQAMTGGKPLEIIPGHPIDFIKLQAENAKRDQERAALGPVSNGNPGTFPSTTNLDIFSLFGSGSTSGNDARSQPDADLKNSYAYLKEHGPYAYDAYPPNDKGPYRPSGVTPGDYYYDVINDKRRKSGWFAEGGFHNAQIARGGMTRIWNEPETGGEAYIPMGIAKRARSEAILKTVAHEFGYGMMKYGNGGINGPAGLNMVGGNRYGTQAQQAATVVVPVSKQETTNFNGPIQGVSMEGALAFAKRKQRQRNLTN